MIKALFRKQFAELISQFSRTSGSTRSTTKRGVLFFAAIIGILYLSLGVSFFAVSKELLKGLTEATFPLFYMVIGLISTAIGLLGSVFNAYTTIFDAKDTEMLLSLPIPPRRIVLTRVLSLTAMTLLYSGAVLLPAAISFLLYANATPLGIVNALFLFLPLVLLVEAITLGIAFLVAALARRVKRKKAVTLIFSVALTLLFYLVYFRMQNMVNSLLALGEIPRAMRYALFFYYSMGRASQGSPIAMLIVMATGVGAFLLATFLLSRNFIKFTTVKRSAAMTGKKGVIKSASRRLSLFKREWKIFSSSPSYVMNCAFGVIFLFAIPIVAIVKAEVLRSLLNTLATVFPKTNGCAIAATLLLLTEGMSCITAPSVSIEGKRIGILRSLPIATTEVFAAKIALHLAVVLPGALFATVTLGALLGADALTWVFLPILSLAHALFTACFGLCMNLCFPVLNWTDEMTAVKSGVGVLISVFGTMLLTLSLGGLYFPFAIFLSDGVYLLIVTILYLVADGIMIRWLKTKGRAKFERLG